MSAKKLKARTPKPARTPHPSSDQPNLGGAILPSSEKGGNAPCVTRFELAGLLHVSLRTVDRMIAAEEINVHHVRGKAVRFLRADVEEYLKANTETSVTLDPTLET